MGICALHDFMLINHLRSLFAGLGHHGIRLLLGIIQHGIRLGLGFIQNGFLLADDFLIFLNFIRYPESQLYQQFLQLFLIDNNLAVG